MKPDADRLRAVADEAERAGSILAAACARGEGLAQALAQLDPTGAAGDRREIFHELSVAFYRGLGATARAQVAKHFSKP